ncbi:MAG: bifunctional homocysteine S-methyltransferase/methylenetetrahydrofolate reductase, partial [Planctomycetota bacterium]|nr:bifunctional homocysteine S-methyltransferase/methylenetetrahydrofolate reductase [Planctomycetota bacterium]
SDRPSLAQVLAREVLVFDGAMGTQLNNRGLPFDRCFELASLEHPEWVEAIHKEFIEAGASGIHTNTFAANTFKLGRHGLDNRMQELLRASVECAQTAAAQDTWVVGAVGPLGVEIEPLGRLGRHEAREEFIEVVSCLAESGVHAISFETFSSSAELVEAVSAAKGVCDLPVFAHLAVNREAKTMYGTDLASAAQRLENAGADILGVNCSGGPRMILNAAREMLAATAIPVSARPNAGVPRQMDGRVFYENNPDYFARFARRFLQAGGRMLGGCCGTTSEHIRAMAQAVRAVGAQEKGVVEAPIIASKEVERPQKPMPLRARSGFGRLLADGACPVSVELVPPKTPDMDLLRQSARELKAAGADLINLPDGPRASARVSNMASATVLQKEAGVETLLHFCCRDRNLLGMQSDLMGAEALGLRNLLVITGDPPYQGNYPDLTAVFDVDSIGLCNIIDNLNHGLDLGGNVLDTQTHFTFGAALNPTALDLNREMERFAWKVDAGVDFAVTQPIFDLEGFLDFMKSLPHNSPPIMAGIWPLRSLRNAEFLASEVPGVEIPDSILEEMRQAHEAGVDQECGLEIARRTVVELHGKVGGFQIAAPFNKVAAPIALLETIAELR